MKKLNWLLISKRIARSRVDELVGYILGLNPVLSGILVDVFKKTYPMLKNPKMVFLNWELKWREKYYEETNRVLKYRIENMTHELPQIVLNELGKKYDLTQIIFERETKEFKISSRIKDISENTYNQYLKILRHENKILKNYTNLRLVNFVEEENNILLSVQPVDYFDYIHTNLILDAKENECDSLRESYHGSGKIEELKDSDFANILGINILLFTADGSLVIQKRSKEVIVRPNEWCSSASGTFSINDLPCSKRTLKEIPVLREALEELGVKNRDLDQENPESTGLIFLGITRELIRGGQPEMFFFINTGLSKNKIIESWENIDKEETKELNFFHFGNTAVTPLDNEDKKYLLRRKCDAFIKKYLDDASIPLLTNLILWLNYRLKNPINGF